MKLFRAVSGVVVSVAWLPSVACGGSADAGDQQAGQGLEEQPSSGDNASTSASTSSTSSTSSASTAANSASAGGSGGSGTTGMQGASGNSGGTSSSGGGQGGSSAGDAASSTSQAGGSGGAAGGSSDAGTTDAGSCEEIACLRPYECAASCDSPIVYSGCCPCEAGQVDQFVECSASEECEAGDSKSVDCNTCSCLEGRWACTEKACETEPVACGGWLGNTCQPDEYCAYQPGQHCGAADASAYCEPRPQGCTLEYAPVCGCDGETYSNACAAAASGTGVNNEGECS